ncbi:MAG: methyl-accepting chemotaxis protein [Mariprofundus sp.]|nr:methyl-accepting chemotaxis protein [Mariprofundus sp.]
MKSESIASAKTSLKQLAKRNFMLSLLLFIILISIIFVASWRDSSSMNQLVDVYDDQFRVGQLKASMSDVMVPINDFTMTADTKNFARIRKAIDVFSRHYNDITAISYLTADNIQSLQQINKLMSEVKNIANDVADGKISADQAAQVAVIAQNLVLSAQFKLGTIIQSMNMQLKQHVEQRAQQANMQLYGLLAFIVLIVLLLELLNRKLLTHAQTVSKASDHVVERAGDIVEVNKIQTSMTEQQTRFMDKVIKGLELIAVSGAKIPLATRKLEKNAVVIASFAKGGGRDVENILQSIHATGDSIASLTDKAAHHSNKLKHILQALGQIQNIADEANLLALNASIDGTSSITHEVQQLADQIGAHTDEIRTAVQAISQASDDTDQSKQKDNSVIERMAQEFQNTSDVLQRIEKLSENNAQAAIVIAQATAQQNVRNQKILMVLRHISELLHSSDDKLQAYKDASDRLTAASESLQDMT